MPAPSRPDPERLAATIVEMRRALRRSLRPADAGATGPERATPDPGAEPSPLEAEVVRYVAGHPGAGTSAIARALRLRPNTVSGLCSALVRSGVLRREQDPRDRRAARFQLTDEAAARRHRRMASRGDRLQRALDALGDDDARAIAAALPALERLIDALEAEQPSS